MSYIVAWTERGQQSYQIYKERYLIKKLITSLSFDKDITSIWVGQVERG